VFIYENVIRLDRADMGFGLGDILIFNVKKKKKLIIIFSLRVRVFSSFAHVNSETVAKILQ
jgi:hypothetical protein